MAQATATQPIPGSGAVHLSLEGRARSRLRRVRWRRLVAVVLGIPAILAVLYLVAANVLLRTRLLRDLISREPAALRFEYDSAYSIVPGRVHVEGLTIRGRQRALEWFFTLDRADVSISLVDLLHKRFHATRVRSSGFAIRVRLRLEPAQATADVLAALPPIEGFADPPLLEVGPEPPPLTDADYNLWTVHLEDVEVEQVREVWIHTVRSEGDSRVRGRWLFRPRRWLDVGPTTVDANGVDVSYGSQRLATGLHGSFGATVHPFDLRQSKGLAIFEHVSHSAQLEGRADVAGALRLLAPRSGLRFTRWEGPLDARVVLDHGKLSDGTLVGVEAPDGVVEAKGLVFEGPIRTELAVAGDLATIDARVSGLRVSHGRVEAARVASIAATVSTGHLQLAHAFDDARFALDVGGAETDDVGAWAHFLPSTSPYVVRSGKVTADAHADGSLAEARGRADLRLLARRFTVERGSDRLTADVTGDARLVEVTLLGGWAVGEATITSNDVAARLGRAVLGGRLAAHVDLRRWTWAERRFDFSGSSVVLRGLSASSARGGAAVVVVPSITAAAPRLAFAPSGVDGHVTIDLPRAEVAHLGRVRELLALPPGLRIVAGKARAKLRADVELGSGEMQGDGEVVAQGVRGRVGATELFGDVTGAVRARRTGDALGSTDFSGSSLAVRRAGAGSVVSPEDVWWGNAVLRRATLRTSGGVRFDAQVHLTAKDATPATVLVSENTAVPTWAADIFEMPVLAADARVRVAPSSIEVRSLVAHGGGTSLRAEYAKRHGRQDGAVLMDLGWISLGYDLAEDASGLVFFGSDSWYGQKTAAMRSAAAAATGKTEAAEQLARYSAMTPELRYHEARALAAGCTPEVRACDGASIQNLLRAAADAGEREALSGIAYAPLVVAAAKRGTDGTTLDPVVIGSLAEAMRIGGESTLDNIPCVASVAAAGDSDAARGKVIAVTGRTSSIRHDGPYTVGTLTTEAEPVYFVTPFATETIPEACASFRGVFVQRYAPAEQPPEQAASLVLVGAFCR